MGPGTNAATGACRRSQERAMTSAKDPMTSPLLKLRMLFLPPASLSMPWLGGILRLVKTRV